MPGAIPGVGECKICFEIVPSVKVLDCGHSLCLPCATRILESTGHKSSSSSSSSSSHTSTSSQSAVVVLTCPECRATTEFANGSQGARSLKTRYFGSLRCDLCLEKKDADDCWWCAECVRTLCSKCSIKEHSKKGHTISEWNKLEPVKYSVNYISQVKTARQGSTEAEHNRRIVNTFLTSVEDSLHKELTNQPELDRLQNDLFERYGSRFKYQSNPHQPLSVIRRGSASSPNLLSKEQRSGSIVSSHHRHSNNIDEGARVVAKVLQLAGANISETAVPSLSDQRFQLHFTVTPDDVAKYLRSKVEFLPVDPTADEDEENGKANEVSCRWRGNTTTTTTTNNTPASRHSYHHMDRIREEEASNASSSAAAAAGPPEEFITDDIFLSSSTPGRGDIVDLDFDGRNLLALRYSTSEVCVLNLQTRRTLSTLPVQTKYECRSLTFSELEGVLYLALQSTTRRHEWMLEAVDLAKSPTSILFTTPFDIDPEDRVDHLQLCIASGKKELSTLYEIRACSRNVSEIWKATLERKSKTPGKVKLKESMVYQKDESRFTRVLVVPPQQTSSSSSSSNNKESCLFVWDDLSKSLYRLIIRDKRCYACTRIVASPTLIPCSLDADDQRLWLFDPCTRAICRSSEPATNKSPINLREVYAYRRAGGLHRMWMDYESPDGSGDWFVAVHVAFDSKSIKIVKFPKIQSSSGGETAAGGGKSAFGEGGRAAIKRRSFSARV